jgi:aryl-alcohol dehydrogenase-like predicted oxidoreductase
VRYIGVSNFDVPQMEAAWRVFPFQTLQPRYNMLDREVEAQILPYCVERGIGVLAHSPLAKGLLTGKYRSQPSFPPGDERGQMPRFSGAEFEHVLTRTHALEDWARERGHSLVELAIAWVLAHPAVTVCLCGAKSEAQVDDHVRAASWSLSDQDRQELEQLLSPAGALIDP